MKFSTAKLVALENLIAHGGPNGKGKPMWCRVEKIAKVNTIEALYRADLMLINEKNNLLVRISDAGRRQHQAWASMVKGQELEKLRQQQREEFAMRKALSL